MNDKVAIIILNWNGSADTIECLTSVGKIQYPNVEIIVVDNGSTDGSPGAIKTSFPYVTIINNPVNRGYAEGNNVGIRHALKNNAEFILLLNNDTVVNRDILTILLKAAQDHPEAGVFSTSIYSYQERDLPTFTAKYWDHHAMRFLERHHGVDDDAVETDYVDGSVMFFRRAVVEKAGFFEPSFFLNYDEIDWCCRVKRSGFTLLIIPRAKVWHKVSRSFGGKGPLFYYFFVRNRLYWAQRNLPALQRWHEYAAVLSDFFPHSFYGKKTPLIKRMYWDILLLARERMIVVTKLIGIGNFLAQRFGGYPVYVKRIDEKYFKQKLSP
ncbi:MAG: glycosyltransferase family 2 protein [Candidatus Omnitrophota bacterium]